MKVYVSAPACAEAQGVAKREEGRAGDVRVRVVCLADAEKGGRLDLATIGNSARRATQDSTTIAYIGEQNQEAVRFSRPIVEEAAGIAEISGVSGSTAMKQVLNAVRDSSGSDNLRESVLNALH